MKNWRSFPIKERSYRSEFGDKLLIRYRGNWDNIEWDQTIAVVGSRKMSMYGERVIEKCVAQMAVSKMIVVSGFMYGADTKAHKETCKNGGKTIAVLGSGIDYLYPRENEELYSQILSFGGLVISQYEDIFQPTPWSYPERNKTVISLSKIGVVVVEAEIKSGSMLTAKLCSSVNKALWAVPGPITSRTSEGTNSLIADGEARMFRSLEDITDRKQYVKQQNWLEKEEGVTSEIVQLLASQDMSLDMLAKKLSSLTIKDISQKLSLLEIEGKVTEKNGLWRSCG